MNNLMTKLFTGIGSVSASIHNGVDNITSTDFSKAPQSIKSVANKVKETSVECGSAIAQGYMSKRQPKVKQLEMEL